MYPEYIPQEDEILPTEEQPLPAAASPTADSLRYVPESDSEEEPEEDDEDPEEDPTDYPANKEDDDDDDEDKPQNVKLNRSFTLRNIDGMKRCLGDPGTPMEFYDVVLISCKTP
ncbi:hypothetical protein Tco_1320704 [Tanacetum coccineum]